MTMTLPIETLTPPPPPAMGAAEAKALLAYIQAATEAHNPGVSSGERVLLCAAVGWLREVVEGRAFATPNPFYGWAIQPWNAYNLAVRSTQGTRDNIGFANSEGHWRAWLPFTNISFASGNEPGSTPEERQAAARRACENALRARGAKL